MLHRRRSFVLGCAALALTTEGGASTAPHPRSSSSAAPSGAAPDVATLLAGPDANAIPLRPDPPTPGRPGDFGFLTGEWRIRNRQRRASGEWLEFDGEATVHAILGGVGSVEELRIPARDFSGMGLRLLDVEQRVWSDYWVNAKSGVLGAAGLTGSFENGAGIFTAEDTVDGVRTIYAGIWDRITPTSCRWRQSASKDGGRTWDTGWLMAWTRVR